LSLTALQNRRTEGLAPMLTLPMLLVALSAAPPQDSPDPARERSRDFVLTYRANVRDIPADVGTLDIWLPVPQTDRHQTIHRLTIDSPVAPTIGREERFGNHCLHVRVASPRGAISTAWTAVVTRRENDGIRERLSDEERALDLGSEPLVPLGGRIRELADLVTAGQATDAAKARAIYNTVTATMRYDKSGTGWGRGDALFACDARRGNCTDFHALAIGMARSAGIPARFAIGLPLPERRSAKEAEVQAYHCWAELYVDGRGWVPIDASEAVKNPAKREYFFGHHDANRLELSRGRNVTLCPAQHGPALNFFVDPYAEVDGRPHKPVDRRVTFRDSDGTGDAAPSK
jgi:transglutaminase-like putative cysteine protease